MKRFNCSGVTLGLVLGTVGATSLAFLMGQGASQPVKSETQYFVTADGDHAHLWVREGANLRVVGHGECKDCPMHGDDHDHGHDNAEHGHEHAKPAK